MKKFSLPFMALLMVSALSGCVDTIDVKDGRVPESLLSAAQLWTGSYSGRFDGLSTEMTFSLDGDRPVVTFNRDLAGNTCNSRVGELKSIGHEKAESGETVENLTFELDPGQCGFQLQGRSLSMSATVSGGKVTSISMSYLKRTEMVQHCDWTGGGWVGGHHGHPEPVPPTYQCWQDMNTVYATGKLNRTLAE
jgi:hypothetical protein